MTTPEHTTKTTERYIHPPIKTEFIPTDELTPAAAKQQAAALREAIHAHDYHYYVRADPVIADRAYDALVVRLETLEEAFDIQTATSPTTRVGGPPIDEFETVGHEEPLLSIQQSGDATDVRAFARRVRGEVSDRELSWVCEPKFDGISLVLTYENGQLARAVTRGDGAAGDDVTANAKTVPEIPLQLRGDPPAELAVRGELYMPRDEFAAYNARRIEQGEEPFANPRNATAGTIRLHDPSAVAERPLSYYAFRIHRTSGESVSSRLAGNKQLQAYGFATSPLIESVNGITGRSPTGIESLTSVMNLTSLSTAS